MLDAAVRAGSLSFFEAVRLPARNDALGELTLERVPGLGIAPPKPRPPRCWAPSTRPAAAHARLRAAG